MARIKSKRLIKNYRGLKALFDLFCPSKKVKLKEAALGFMICQMSCVPQKHGRREHHVKYQYLFDEGL